MVMPVYDLLTQEAVYWHNHGFTVFDDSGAQQVVHHKTWPLMRSKY